MRHSASMSQYFWSRRSMKYSSEKPIAAESIALCKAVIEYVAGGGFCLGY